MGPLLMLVSLLAQPGDTASLTALELELELSRTTPGGETEDSSYTLHVLADGTSMTRLQSGIEVAVPAADELRYRNVGLNLQCRATRVGERFRIHLAFERSSLGNTDPSGHPTFRLFNSQSEFWARDGQTIDVVTGPDPDTGAPSNIRATVKILER